MRGRGWVVAVAVALAFYGFAPALAAQSGPLVLTGSREQISVEVARHRGWAAHDVRALQQLGATIEGGVGRMSVVLFGDTLRFRDASTYFDTPSGVAQLAYPAYGAGDGFYLPRSFFTDWLPTRYGRWLRADAGGRLQLRTVASAVPSGRRIVVLDPGHGGVDPGKVSSTGVREKDIALAVARQVKDLLRERGYVVYMTREADTLIDLADRPRLANAWKGDDPAALFVSIHANAHRQASARGFETFFLSEARTEDERRVAEAENAAVRFESGTPEDTDPLAVIAASLRTDYYQRASNDLAEVIQRNVARIHPGPDRGVKQAGFRVLVGALMPAVLVETAFLSNPREARLLADGTFRSSVADAVTDAIDAYFQGHEHLWVVKSD